MSEIKIIDSETDLKKDIIRNFKYNMLFDQKLFYFDEGAENYYHFLTKKHLKENKETANNYKNIIQNNIKDINNYVFISLGCGNANTDKELLGNFNDELEYIGIDSSMSMIEKAQSNMKDCNFKKQFIYADFSGEKFKAEIEKLIPANKKRIIALLGGTIGNVPQNYIVNILRNMLKEDDILLLDCRIQEEATDLNANIFFKEYLNFLNDEHRINILKYPLEVLNIPTKIGKFNLDMKKEKPINSLIFDFSFKINQDFEFKINNEKFTLLKDDAINLLRVRVYEYNSLKNFFEKRDFKLIDKTISGERLNIVFQKQ